MQRKENTMSIRLNKQEVNKFKNFYDKSIKNQEIADLYNVILDNSYDFSNNYDKDLSYLDNICYYFNLSNDDFLYFKDYHLENNFKLLDNNKYLANPFIKDIKLNDVVYKNYAFLNNNYNSYEPFLYDEMETTNNYLEITKIGYFNKPYSYLSLVENNEVWMLITPHEINTMEKAINHAKGNVLTFGLGIGYFSYMASLKDEVTSITIIEKNKDIIELFKKHILPQFKTKAKINIINEDAFKYATINNLKQYDYLFVDFYRNTNDGIGIYLKLIDSILESNIKYDFWIEKSIIIMLRRCLINAMYELIFDINEQIENKNEIDIIIDKFKERLNKLDINSYDDLISYLDDNKIVQLIR